MVRGGEVRREESSRGRESPGEGEGLSWDLGKGMREFGFELGKGNGGFVKKQINIIM